MIRTPPQVERARLIARWKAEADKLDGSLMALYLLWSTTKATIEVVRDSAFLQGQPSYYYNQFTMRGLLESVIIGLRRQVDTDTRSLSLLNFLKDLDRHRTTYTLDDCIAAHLERGKRTETDPIMWEERARYVYSCLAGDEETMASADLIGKGIGTLKGISEKIHVVANKYVAHYDKNAPDVFLTMERLENYVNITLSMANLYLPIFTGCNSDSFSHFDRESWLAMFEKAWR
jgi:AbiU2